MTINSHIILKEKKIDYGKALLSLLNTRIYKILRNTNRYNICSVVPPGGGILPVTIGWQRCKINLVNSMFTCHWFNRDMYGDLFKTPYNLNFGLFLHIRKHMLTVFQIKYLRSFETYYVFISLNDIFNMNYIG